jgi:hypothetical protein
LTDHRVRKKDDPRPVPQQKRLRSFSALPIIILAKPPRIHSRADRQNAAMMVFSVQGRDILPGDIDGPGRRGYGVAFVEAGVVLRYTAGVVVLCGPFALVVGYALWGPRDIAAGLVCEFRGVLAADVVGDLCAREGGGSAS